MAFLTYKPSKPSQLNIDSATSAHKPDLLDPQYFGFLDTDGSDAKNKFQWKTVLKIGKFYTLDPDPFFHIKFLIEMYPNP